MRIIAGRLGGHQFASPKGHRTHPMSDKGRGALFNALGDIAGLTLLDAFAGSGALSIEAISRGAAHATAVDIDKAATDTISKNAETLGVGRQVKVVRAGLSSWLDTSGGQLFDVILADPPYDDLQLPSIQKLLTRLKPGGIFALSWPGKELPPDFGSLDLLQTNAYGDSQLVFYRATG
jgi:16S rRNA (guanine966-N2)-methyltransferase